MQTQFVLKGPVKKFENIEEAWHYVLVPPQLLYKLAKVHKTRTGTIGASIKVGHSTWNGVLAPMGRGNYFIAFPHAVIEQEEIEEGESVRVMVLIH